MKKNVLTPAMQAVYGKKLQWIRKILLCCIVLSVYSHSLGQKSHKAKGQYSFSDMFKPYKPSPEFLKQNPDFLKDSSYTLTAKIIPIQYLHPTDLHSSTFEFNSSKYPIKSVPVKAILNPKIVYTIITGTLEFANSKYLLDLSYDNKSEKPLMLLNEECLKAIREVVVQNNFNVLDMYSFLPTDIRKTVYLALSTDIQILDGRGVYKGNSLSFEKKKGMPNIGVFRMYVINSMFDTLKSYTQTIFYDHYTKKKYSPQTQFFICFQKTLPGLLAQFANDTPLQNKIAQNIDLTGYDPKYLEGIEAVRKLKQILQKKESIIKALRDFYDMKAEADKMENGLKQQQTIDAITAPFAAYSAQPATAASTITYGAAQIANNILDDIYKHQAENKAAKANEIIEMYKNLQQQEASLFNKLKGTGLINESEFADKQFTQDELINKLGKSIKEGKASLENQITANSSYLDTKIKSQMPAPLTSAMTAGNAQLTPNLGAVPMSSSDPCQTQANTAWRSSVEYKRYNQDPTNANASDCKAKLIELTLQYCGSRLPPAEVSALKKTAASERNVARQLRAGTPNINLGH